MWHLNIGHVGSTTWHLNIVHLGNATWHLNIGHLGYAMRTKFKQFKLDLKLNTYS
jgi:hypothetical protein